MSGAAGESDAAQALAEACARAMWADDRASQALGMAIEEIAPGRAVLTMAITEAMANGHGIGHGGFVFLLADSAFAFACNSHGVRTVASHCAVTFVKPVRIGDRLHAEAVERHREGRSGIYDTTVKTTEGEVVAEFRGHSRTIGGALVGKTT